MPSELTILLHALATDPGKLGSLADADQEQLLRALRAAVPSPSASAPSPLPLSAPPPVWMPDDLLTVDEAAAALRVSTRWLYRHSKQLPFARKLSRKVLRFSRTGIARWLATRRA